ncbi:hypothetical protein SAMN06265218_10731 [Fodinibius sediminis]|uniref:Uncharacterized protein n=1 Tax=Fodinibius sediminis TaxID=1214077 RepID=A0A521CRK5_9BACT|nr:hypothetical protein SAMN06265218_10731 [Fodinibius sediminis]
MIDGTESNTYEAAFPSSSSLRGDPSNLLLHLPFLCRYQPKITECRNNARAALFCLLDFDTQAFSMGTGLLNNQTITHMMKKLESARK